MGKDLAQLGFRLEREDREWFVRECETKETSAATALAAYIKKCRELGNIDPLEALVNNSAINNAHTTINTNAINVVNKEEITELVKQLVAEQLVSVNKDVSNTINRLQTELEQVKQLVNNSVNSNDSSKKSKEEEVKEEVLEEEEVKKEEKEEIEKEVSEEDSTQIPTKRGATPKIGDPDLVREIRNFASKNSGKATIEQFNLSQSTISKIKSKKHPYDFE